MTPNRCPVFSYATMATTVYERELDEAINRTVAWGFICFLQYTNL